MGRTVVGLHGFTGAPAAWKAVAGALPAELEMRCPALLGHADGPADGAGFAAEVERLGDWLETVASGPHRPFLAGYSLGARLALALAIERPRAICGLLLIGVHPGVEDPAERAARHQADERLAARLEREGLESFLDYWQGLPLFASQASAGADVLAAQDRWRRSHCPVGLARALRQLGLAAMPNYGGRLGELDVPVRLMVGEHDAKFRQLATEMKNRLLHGTLEVVSGAGHNLILEQPSRVAAALVEEIDRCRD